MSLQETQKKAKYTAACKAQGWNFVPAAFDTWGGMGPGAKSLLGKLLKRAVAGTPWTCVRPEHMSCVST